MLLCCLCLLAFPTAAAATAVACEAVRGSKEKEKGSGIQNKKSRCGGQKIGGKKKKIAWLAYFIFGPVLKNGSFFPLLLLWPGFSVFLRATDVASSSSSSTPSSSNNRRGREEQ